MLSILPSSDEAGGELGDFRCTKLCDLLVDLSNASQACRPELIQEDDRRLGKRPSVWAILGPLLIASYLVLSFLRPHVPEVLPSNYCNSTLVAALVGFEDFGCLFLV